MIKRILIRLLLVILTCLLLVSTYFYFQHRITYWNYSVNNEYKVSNAKVEITEIYIKNYEENENSIFEKRRAIFDLIGKVPIYVATPLFKLNYFYSKPYKKIDNKYVTIGLKGKIISDTFIDDKSIDAFRNNIVVEIVDDVDVHYSSRNGSMHEDGSRSINFRTEGRNFPLQKLNSKLKIYIKDKQLNSIQEYTIEPKFVKKVYGFFDKKPRDFE